MQEIVQQALQSLSNMPPTSWGETLTCDEVLNLRSGSSHWVHSGYQVSLREGQMKGIPPSTNTTLMRPANYSVLYPETHIAPPPTSQCLPMYFGQSKSPSPPLPSMEFLHISVLFSDNPDSGQVAADLRTGLVNSDHHADLGHCPDPGSPKHLSSAAATWMEMVDWGNVAGTTPAPSSPWPQTLEGKYLALPLTPGVVSLA